MLPIIIFFESFEKTHQKMWQSNQNETVPVQKVRIFLFFLLFCQNIKQFQDVTQLVHTSNFQSPHLFYLQRPVIMNLETHDAKKKDLVDTQM